MKRKVLGAIKRYDLLTGAKTVLCAVSGGADSMAMLAVLRELSSKLGIEVSAAHLNHMLRGEEAKRDEDFVKRFCEAKAIPFYCERIDVKEEAGQKKKGIEEAAREVRYAFFERARKAQGADVVATAHTANDNLETILFNMIRGTGILGLCGIPPKRDAIIRPMILSERREIEAYLLEHQIPFVTDSSNLSNEYSRNKIRNLVIPKLFEIEPSVFHAAGVMADALRLDADFILNEARKIADCAEFAEDSLSIDAALLKEAHPAVAGRALRLLFEKLTKKSGDLSVKQVEGVLALCAQSHPSKRLSLPCMTVAARRYGALLLEKSENVPGEISGFPLLSFGKYDIYGTNYFAEYKKAENDEKIYNLSQTFLIDCGKINKCLFIRSRREGDEIKLPARRTKSLKKLFIEMKVPAKERAVVPVVADGERVVAVYGVGTDCRYQAKSADNAVLLRIGRTDERHAK